MFSSIRTKITVPVVVVLALLVFLIVAYVYVAVESFADERSDERMLGASQAAHFYLERLEGYNRMAARAVSGSRELDEFVQSWRGSANDDEDERIRQGLLEYINVEKDRLGLSAVVVTDINGVVILRTHEVERFGDSLIGSGPVYRALTYGAVSTVYYVSRSPQVPVGISSAAPVFDNGGGVVGTISAIVNMGENDFVDTFGTMFNASVTVFRGYKSVASTLYKDDGSGERAVGTIAQDHVQAAVLEDGEPFGVELVLFGIPHYAYYFPLFGEYDEPVGMFFVGFSLEQIINGTNALLRNLILLGIVGLAVSVAVMLFVINKSASKVTLLAHIVEGITSGNPNADVSAVRASNDEVGALARSIFSLVDMVKRLSNILQDMARGNVAVDLDGENDTFCAAEAMIDVTGLKNFIAKTERQTLEAEAANRAKSEFLSAVSHEIRTPMNAILGITEMQIQKQNIDDETREALEKVYASGDMLLGIINDILDLSKIEAGRMEFIIEKYEIASLIGDTAQLNMMRIGRKNIEFEIFADENMPEYMSGDELRIKQILNNILSNAFKYTEKGKVKLSVHAEDGAEHDSVVLVVSVSDTGQGMTKEQIDRIFEGYTRFNLKANRSAEGTGLGMNITKNLTHMMGGNISVESEPNEGSVFTVRLPQKKAGEGRLGKETAENLSKFRTSGRAQMKRVQITREPMPYGKILIVDDVDTNIYVVKGLLAPYGLQTDEADSGLAAIAKIKAGNVYDVILMDYMMPKIDGIEATKRIREMGYTQPIVALTANAIVGQSELFMESGFDDFISKPIDIRYMNQMLNKFVRDRHPAEVVEEARSKADDEQIALDDQSFDDYLKSSGLYEQVYRDFGVSQKNVMTEIMGAVGANDFRNAQRLAHTLKSMAALISETNLVELAQKAESAFVSETIPIDVIGALEAEVKRVLAKVENKQ